MNCESLLQNTTQSLGSTTTTTTTMMGPSRSPPSSNNEETEADGQKICREQPITQVPVSVKIIASSDLQVVDPPSIIVVEICREQPIIPVPVSVKSIVSSDLQAMNSPSILVVEDTAMCAKLLCMTLRKLLCSAKWVKNGQEAVDLLRTSEPGMYNFILMDLRMPVMDGLTATAIIKKELKLDIPVIALTGDTSRDVKSQCEKIGFAEFCGKPLKRDQLLNVIEKYSGHRCVTK
jgi:CheY-like chemotaxis protein